MTINERVHIVEAVHDGVPIAGLAELGGTMWLFERVFSEERDDYADEYHLWMPDPELVRLMNEQHERFRRWLAAGMPTRGELPVLDAERADAEAGQRRIAELRDRLGAPRTCRLRFIRSEASGPGHDGWRVAMLGAS